MFWKGVFVGSVLTVAPIWLYSSSEGTAPPAAESALWAVFADALSDPADAPAPPAGQVAGPSADRIRRAFRRLEERIVAMQSGFEERLQVAEARAQALETELDEVWELSEQRGRHSRDCTPSRSRIARWQRYHRRGDERRANAALERMITSLGGGNDSLNSAAWELLTERRFAGRHDDLALKLAERMQQRPRELTHYMIDTIALAKFRDGQIDEAVRLQREAIRRGGRDRDYYRRLREYEAAARRRGTDRPSNRLVTGE